MLANQSKTGGIVLHIDTDGKVCEQWSMQDERPPFIGQQDLVQGDITQVATQLPQLVRVSLVAMLAIF